MFSIVMLTYNNHDTFKRCISSMTPLLLDERVKEILILDNGSHEIALIKLLKNVEETFNKIKVIYGSENVGIAKGRKILYDLCSEEYILSFDSDIVIIDATILLEMFLNAIKVDKMMLVGGGGGNHPFFPAVFRNDIINLPTPENPNEVVFVDEVAGWFHGFRSKDLKSKGGPLYMDEIFSPFWAEDSDFCYQIKLLGGKCCIIGRGSVAHVWSSCHKEEKQKPIEAMWKKLTDKWYPKFDNGVFNFNINERFYLDNYEPELEWIEELKKGEVWKAEKGKIHDVRDHFLVNGMRKGCIPHKKYINSLFKGVHFISNAELKYKNEIIHTRDFIDKYMCYQYIIEENYKIIDNNLPIKINHSNLIFMSVVDQKKGIEKLKSLVDVNHNEFVVIVCGIKNETDIIREYLKKEFKYFYLSEFVNYYDHTIPFIITMLDVVEKTRFEKILKITDGDFSEEEEIENDLFAVEIILDVYRYRKEKKVFKNGVYSVKYLQLVKIINSEPILKTLDLALRYPCKYSKLVSPKYVPNIALSKIMECMISDNLKNSSLIIYVTSLDDKETIAHNNKMIKKSDPNCEIVMMSYGDERFIKPSSLDADYFYITKKADFNYENWFTILPDVKLDNYSNIIFFRDEFKIEEPIVEFMKASKYQNIAMFREGNEIKYNLFSIVAEDVIPFVNMIIQINEKVKEDKTKDTNLEGTINLNAQKNFGLRSLWYVKKTEEECETIIEYSKFKDKFTPDEDFPLSDA